jgi:hypothetical protein
LKDIKLDVEILDLARVAFGFKVNESNKKNHISKGHESNDLKDMSLLKLSNYCIVEGILHASLKLDTSQ